jgi:hypothetical protein
MKTMNRSKGQAAVLVSAVVSGAAIGLAAEQASAGIYPSGCRQWATYAPFADNCWLGRQDSYESTDAGFIYGIQWAVGDPYDASYQMENDFTDAIEKRVIGYQQQRGLEADGVVGTASWSSLQSDLVWRNCGTYGTRTYFAGAVPCGFDGGSFFLSSTTAHWWTLEPNDFVAATPRAAYSFAVQFSATS